MSFTFNGHSCEEFGLFVQKYPERQMPKKKFIEYNVPGGTGKVYVPQGGYENVIQPYEVYVRGSTEGFQKRASKIMKWLLTEEPKDLTDEYDPTSVRKALFVSGGNWINHLNKFGTATLSFDCDPRRFDVSPILQDIPIAAGGSVMLYESFTAERTSEGYIASQTPVLWIRRNPMLADFETGDTITITGNKGVETSPGIFSLTQRFSVTLTFETDTDETIRLDCSTGVIDAVTANGVSIPITSRCSVSLTGSTKLTEEQVVFVISPSTAIRAQADFRWFRL